MGNYDNNLWNIHSPYCLFLFILLFCRVEFLQKPMKKKSLSAISNSSEIQHPTLLHLYSHPYHLIFPWRSWQCTEESSKRKGLESSNRRKRSSIDSSFPPCQLFLPFPLLLEELPALPDSIRKLKSQWCERLNYTSDIREGCDCII